MKSQVISTKGNLQGAQVLLTENGRFREFATSGTGTKEFGSILNVLCHGPFCGLNDPLLFSFYIYIKLSFEKIICFTFIETMGQSGYIRAVPFLALKDTSPSSHTRDEHFNQKAFIS